MSSKLRASVLSFRRMLDPGDALMSSTLWGDRTVLTPLQVQEKTVRGTISNHPNTRKVKEGDDPLKLDADLCKPNIQTVDYARVPHTDDTLVVQFSLRVHGDWGSPDACNNDEVRVRLQEMTKDYLQGNGPSKLGTRYAQNLANARWLWRNLLGVESVEVEVHRMQEGVSSRTWRFNALDVSLDDFTSPSTDVQSLGEDIAHALVHNTSCLYRVVAFARIGPGCEVYPSQLFVANKTNKEGEKSRTFFQCSGQGAMTSQKIGNALRTIDNWYSDTSAIGPIAVEPYGAVTSRGAAYRKGQDSNFYTLFEKWLDNKTLTITEQHFVMAVLVRGGVFGTPDEEKQAKKAAEAEFKKKKKAAAKATTATETASEADDEP